MIKQVIQAVKELFGGKDDYEPDKRMPYRYTSTVWGYAARSIGVGEDRNKELHVVEGRGTSTWWPYHEAIVEAFESVKNTPNWDETGGQSDPEPDYVRVKDPGLLAYDQRNLKRN